MKTVWGAAAGSLSGGWVRRPDASAKASYAHCSTALVWKSLERAEEIRNEIALSGFAKSSQGSSPQPLFQPPEVGCLELLDSHQYPVCSPEMQVGLVGELHPAGKFQASGDNPGDRLEEAKGGALLFAKLLEARRSGREKVPRFGDHPSSNSFYQRRGRRLDVNRHSFAAPRPRLRAPGWTQGSFRPFHSPIPENGDRFESSWFFFFSSPLVFVSSPMKHRRKNRI